MFKIFFAIFLLPFFSLGQCDQVKKVEGKFDADSLVLTWDEVKNADLYEIAIRYYGSTNWGYLFAPQPFSTIHNIVYDTVVVQIGTICNSGYSGYGPSSILSRNLVTKLNPDQMRHQIPCPIEKIMEGYTFLGINGVVKDDFSPGTYLVYKNNKFIAKTIKQ
jgi:hypothetical protein